MKNKEKREEEREGERREEMRRGAECEGTGKEERKREELDGRGEGRRLSDAAVEGREGREGRGTTERRDEEGCKVRRYKEKEKVRHDGR